MRVNRLPRTARVALACVLALCLGLAAAQPPAPASKTYYVGSVTSETGAPEPALLDLGLWDGGFAFARLQLPRRQEVLYGSGTLSDATALRLAFRRAEPGEDSWWAAELARSAAAGESEAVANEKVGVLTAARDYDWDGEGRTIVGTLRLATGEPLGVSLARLASAARWTFEQGRVYSTTELPRFHGRAELTSFLEESTLPAQRSFARSGLELEEEGALGWGWWREERVEITGAAGPYLSLLSTVDDYTGGAHPNEYHASYLLSAAEGGVVELALTDVFAGQGWLEELSRLVLDDLARQEAMWVTTGEVAALGLEDLEVFTLDAAGLTFHFSPYLMGPYVQGTFRVTLPYEAIGHLAVAGGPLGAFARGAWPEATR